MRNVLDGVLNLINLFDIFLFLVIVPGKGLCMARADQHQAGKDYKQVFHWRTFEGQRYKIVNVLFAGHAQPRPFPIQISPVHSTAQGKI